MMSCSYYKIKEPFTSIEVNHHMMDRLDIIYFYIGCARSGDLIVPKDATHQVLRMFFDTRNPAVSTHARPNGAIARYEYIKLNPDEQLLSEYGDLVFAEEIIEDTSLEELPTCADAGQEE